MGQNNKSLQRYLEEREYYRNLILHPGKLILKVEAPFPDLRKRQAEVDHKFSKIKPLDEANLPISEHYVPRYEYMVSKVELFKDMNAFDSNKRNLINNFYYYLDSSGLVPSGITRTSLEKHTSPVLTEIEKNIKERTHQINYLEKYVRQIAETCKNEHFEPLYNYEKGFIEFNPGVNRLYAELYVVLEHQYNPPEFDDIETTPLQTNNPLPAQADNQPPRYTAPPAATNNQQVAQGTNINSRPISPNPDRQHPDAPSSATTTRRNSFS
ncbi:MAG: hypothetical protein K6D38_05975 [Pseudobutyrivibrio sp.]|nr:hypothetical protein [Pseudobutyrivibrio sp.]